MPRMSSLVSWGLPGQGTATPPRSGRVTQSLLEAFIRAVSKDECLGKKKRSQDWARPRALWGVSPLPTTAKPRRTPVQVDTHIADLGPPSVTDKNPSHSHTLL